MAIFLVLLEFFGENPNPDGSMPTKRFAGLWQRLYLDGDVTRAFDNKRFAFVRNRVSDMGGIEWKDVTYGEGKAAKWKASGRLREMMESYAGGGASCEMVRTETTTTNASLAGTRRSEPDVLWLGMPSENSRNVGLRPVRVVVGAAKWTLADYFGNWRRWDSPGWLREAENDRDNRRMGRESGMARRSGTKWFVYLAALR